MAIKLIVIQPFADHQAGEEITNQDDIAAILNSDQAAHVVKAAAPDAPEAKTKKAAAAA